MTMKRKIVLAGVSLMVVLVGSVQAGPISCPARDDIKLTATAKNTTYTAPVRAVHVNHVEHAPQWTGESLVDQKVDLKKLNFKKATLQAQSVACDYQGKTNGDSVRMTLKTKTTAKAVGTAWKGNECQGGQSPDICKFE
ncbi:hypothetical protein C1X16_28980 [Pseudomonas sp. FW305-3-2-15-C-R2A1]|uniref:DUF3757 domain-containing protein n=1 Tax=Pseudomonas sp. FW305-3-2-15-C-R2A1 TaxID=2751333 RepID=UPI000C88558B|nr:DUF3757 domain-containing protein [Pseudomonas sp. FW305-3-2-15-C-R2A1]PMV38485.1 hypothetical protein C1X16_28980 [Pseudomonas sp. FW305-3-2-15-C-R2A1]